MSGYEWIDYGACTAVFLLMVALAIFWGREVGLVGYLYWGIASLAPVGVAFLAYWLNMGAVA